MIAANGSKQDFEVWPENWPAALLFCHLQTQWVPGPNGVLGINYLVLYHKLDRMGLEPDEYAQFEMDVQVMELAALEKMQEQKEQA